MSNDKVYYDPFENENYLKEIEAIKMKKFYGKHLQQYLKNLQPEADDGIFRKTRFAPLAVTGFSNKPDQSGRDLRRGGSMVIENRHFGNERPRDKSFNDDIMRLTNENFKLSQKLDSL